MGAGRHRCRYDVRLCAGLCVHAASRPARRIGPSQQSSVPCCAQPVQRLEAAHVWHRGQGKPLSRAQGERAIRKLFPRAAADGWESGGHDGVHVGHRLCGCAQRFAGVYIL